MSTSKRETEVSETVTRMREKLGLDGISGDVVEFVNETVEPTRGRVIESGPIEMHPISKAIGVEPCPPS